MSTGTTTSACRRSLAATGGIFAALSESAATVIEAVAAAKKYGTVVSHDLN